VHGGSDREFSQPSGLLRADDRHRPRRMGQHECDRHGGPGDAFSFCQAVEHGHQLGPHSVAGGETAAGERAPRKRRDAEGRAVVERAVTERLQRHHREFRLGRCQREREVCLQRCRLRWRVVRHAEFAHEASIP
jgi:hypothetical protein